MSKETKKPDTWYQVLYGNNKTEIIKADTIDKVNLIAYRNAEEQKTIVIRITKVK